MDYEKTRMLHVWKDCFDELEFEIQAAERQLQSVNKRIKGLSYDIVLFIGALVIPRLVLIMMSIVPYRPSLFCVLWSGLQSLIMSLYIICMPFFLYRLILSIVLYIMNRPKGESKEPILLEPRDQRRSRDAVKPEKNYRVEQQKLVCILAKYYTKRDDFLAVRKRIDSDEETITLAELYAELEKIPYYQELRPADSFTGAMMKTARRRTFLIFVPVAIYVLWSIIAG